MFAILFGLITLFSTSVEAGNRHHSVIAEDSIKRKTKAIDTTGYFVEVNRVFIVGNRITRDQIILRELSLKKGDIVHTTDLPGILDLDRKKLINTRLFLTVEVRTLEPEKGKLDVLVDVKERWYTFPAPVFELSDRNFNEWWQNYDHDFHRVNYGLRLYQFNMRGRNETLRLLAQLGFQRRFDLSYRIPYIDRRQKQGLVFELGYLETKNLAIRTEDHKYEFLKLRSILRTDRFAGVTYNYRRTFYTTHSLKLEYRNVSVADTVKEENENYIKGEPGSQRYAWIAYQYSVDRRDFFAYPLNGYQFTASASKLGLGLGDDVNKTEANVLVSKYWDLTKKFYLANNTVLYWSTPDDLSYLNYGVLGLRKQFVRGYEIYVIEGPYYFLNKTTFKRQIFSKTYHWGDMPIEQFQHVPIQVYLKTYADFGYVKNYSYYEALGKNTLFSDKLLTGVGGGLDVVSSYDLVLRFEYSLNVENGRHGFFFHVKKEF
jgi:outer membrane protein assembly factor BamA